MKSLGVDVAASDDVTEVARDGKSGDMILETHGVDAAAVRVLDEWFFRPLNTSTRHD
jgi:hypothetical protein